MKNYCEHLWSAVKAEGNADYKCCELTLWLELITKSYIHFMILALLLLISIMPDFLVDVPFNTYWTN